MSGSVKHPRKNKPTFQRYWNEDHLSRNKARREAKRGPGGGWIKAKAARRARQAEKLKKRLAKS